MNDKLFITPEMIGACLNELHGWLTTVGANVKPPRKLELLRFRTRNGYSWVRHIRPGSKRLQFHNEAFLALARYFDGKSWSPDGYKPTPFKTPDLIDHLLTRDGSCCMYCGDELGDDVTVEHWVPASFGGPTNPSNMALMHDACNKELSNLPVSSKIKLILGQHYA